jgi:SWI/SNF-related matrix-associated actin-dependent regulator of chromatin subfamily A member 5
MYSFIFLNIKETLIMVGMSKMQKQLYKRLLLRDIEAITGKNTSSGKTAVLNIVMQLRKCCNHPYLFEGVEDRTLDPLGEHLVNNCGKLNMVDKLLKKLKERGSRVLIFTQMTRILDILEDFLVIRQYKYCRIDGNTDYETRERSIDEFNMENSEKFCFILSTRAGGLGINLQVRFHFHSHNLPSNFDAILLILLSLLLCLVDCGHMHFV